LAAVAARGFRPTGGYTISVRWTPDAALAYMDRHDIAAQIVSLPMTFAGSDDDPQFGVRLSRMINEGHAELIGQAPPAASAPSPRSRRTALNRRWRNSARLGRTAARRCGADVEHGGALPRRPSLEPVLRNWPGARCRCSCTRPTARTSTSWASAARVRSWNSRSTPPATITNALYTGVFRRHPGLRLILAHCGGALPALGWRIGEHTVMGRGPEDADIDPAHVAEVLRGLYYETALAGSRNSLLPTLEVTTADHILFGTDWPAAPEPTVVRNIANLTGFDGFTAEQLRGVGAGQRAHPLPPPRLTASTGIDCGHIPNLTPAATASCARARISGRTRHRGSGRRHRAC